MADYAATINSLREELVAMATQHKEGLISSRELVRLVGLIATDLRSAEYNEESRIDKLVND